MSNHAELQQIADAINEPFPQPRRKDGGTPCGECHLRPGETCDICGAIEPTDATARCDARMDDFTRGEEHER